MTAYEYRGTGSTVQRAGEIRAIFEDAAPVISERPPLHSKEFLGSLSTLFAKAVSVASAPSQAADAETVVESAKN